MKRILALLLVLSILLAVSACSGSVDNPTTDPSTVATTASTTEPPTEPTTAPATEPTTEPATAPTTEPTAEPTMEPTTEPTTEPVETTSPETQATEPTEATTIPTKHIHTWIEATCYMPKNCKICGETEGSANGHDWRDATCYEPPMCAACGVVEGDALGCSFVVEVILPTCTENGCTIQRCVRCNQWDTIASADALEHDYDNGIITSEPTCAQYGIKTYTCNRCGDTYSNTYGEKIPHAYGESVVTKQPSCTQFGSREAMCANCGSHLYESIGMLDHNCDSVVVSQATCTVEGKMKHTCVDCEYTYTSTVDKMAHNYDGAKCSICSKIISYYDKSSSEVLLDTYESLSFHYTGIRLSNGYFKIYIRVIGSNYENIRIDLSSQKINGHSGIGFLTHNGLKKPDEEVIIELWADESQLKDFDEDIIEMVEFKFSILYVDRDEYVRKTSPNAVVFCPYE